MAAQSVTRRLRDLLRRDGPTVLPGAYDALSARIFQHAGFEALYLGGFASGASSLGLPDHSLITMTELLDAARRITSAVDIPVVADLDDAGGNAVNVVRFVRGAESAGLAGVHIEDVVAGKHFAGHDDSLVSLRTFSERIRAGVDARRDDDFLIVARSDSPRLDEMVERSCAAVEAGADMVFLPYLRRRDLDRFREQCDAPMMQIGSGRGDVKSTGAKAVIFPADALFGAFTAVRQMAERLRHGDAADFDPSILTAVNHVVGSPDATAIAERYGVVGLSADMTPSPSERE